MAQERVPGGSEEQSPLLALPPVLLDEVVSKLDSPRHPWEPCPQGLAALLCSGRDMREAVLGCASAQPFLLARARYDLERQTSVAGLEEMVRRHSAALPRLPQLCLTNSLTSADVEALLEQQQQHQQGRTGTGLVPSPMGFLLRALRLGQSRIMGGEGEKAQGEALGEHCLVLSHITTQCCAVAVKHSPHLHSADSPPQGASLRISVPLPGGVAEVGPSAAPCSPGTALSSLALSMEDAMDAWSYFPRFIFTPALHAATPGPCPDLLSACLGLSPGRRYELNTRLGSLLASCFSPALLGQLTTLDLLDRPVIDAPLFPPAAPGPGSAHPPNTPAPSGVRVQASAMSVGMSSGGAAADKEICTLPFPLGALRRLGLHLKGVPVSQVANFVGALPRACPRLQSLDLVVADCEGDLDLRCFAALLGLTHLSLTVGSYHGGVMPCLASLTTLTTLKLLLWRHVGADFDPAEESKGLKALTRLHTLALPPSMPTPLWNALLPALASLPSLRFLHLYDFGWDIVMVPGLLSLTRLHHLEYLSFAEMQCPTRALLPAMFNTLLTGVAAMPRLTALRGFFDAFQHTTFCPSLAPFTRLRALCLDYGVPPFLLGDVAALVAQGALVELSLARRRLYRREGLEALLVALAGRGLQSLTLFTERDGLACLGLVQGLTGLRQLRVFLREVKPSDTQMVHAAVQGHPTLSWVSVRSRYR